MSLQNSITFIFSAPISFIFTRVNFFWTIPLRRDVISFPYDTSRQVNRRLFFVWCFHLRRLVDVSLWYFPFKEHLTSRQAATLTSNIQFGKNFHILMRKVLRLAFRARQLSFQIFFQKHLSILLYIFIDLQRTFRMTTASCSALLKEISRTRGRNNS